MPRPSWPSNRLRCCLLALACAARADTVVLTNGQKIQGTVEGDSPAEVTIRTPEGRLTFHRNRVRAVEKGETQAAPHSATRAGDTPRGMEGTLREIGELDRMREAAGKARQRLAELDAGTKGATLRARELSRRLDERGRELAVLETRLKHLSQGVNPAKPTAEMTETRARMQELVKAGTAERDELQALRDSDAAGQAAMAEAMRQMLSYPARLQKFVVEYQRRKDDLLRRESDPAATAYLAKVEERMRRHLRSLEPETVALERSGAEYLVAVTVGEARQPAKFRLDPSLSHVVVEPEAFNRLKLKPTGDVAELRQASGNVIEMDRVVLPVVQLGRHTLRDVEAGISHATTLPEGCDGSLGLTLLSRFIFTIDINAGTLKLLELMPPE